MEIIKQSKYPENNILKCEKCSCEFKYFDNEVKYRHDEDFGGYGYCSSIMCPGCGDIIILSCEFYEETDWIDYLTILLNKIKNKFYKK